MPKVPRVGITFAEAAVRDENLYFRTYITRKYYGAIQQAGAQTVLLPPVQTEVEMEGYLDLLDGLLLPGGEDIDPRFQDEDPIPSLGLVNPFRDQFELCMARLAYERRLPTLGICRGIQVIAVALGGSIYQDIAALNPIQHFQKCPRWATSHRVSLVHGSFLQRWLEAEAVFTNSFHHQCVKSPPPKFRFVGKTSDGLIEAIETTEGFPFIGVQWHPEELAGRDEATKKLFLRFVESLLPTEKAHSKLVDISKKGKNLRCAR